MDKRRNVTLRCISVQEDDDTIFYINPRISLKELDEKFLMENNVQKMPKKIFYVTKYTRVGFHYYGKNMSIIRWNRFKPGDRFEFRKSKSSIFKSYYCSYWIRPFAIIYNLIMKALE